MGNSGNRTIDRTGRPPAGRLLFGALLAVMIAFQGWVIQTHVHAADVLTVALQKAGEPHAPQPVNDDPAKCPICQEMLHSGLFVAPVWLALFLIAAASIIVPPAVFAAPAFAAISHTWRSRGPPRP